jgi:hypothetical protein
MPYEVKARTPAGEDRYMVPHRDEAVRCAHLLLINQPWCVVEVRDDSGAVVYTVSEGAPDNA